MSACSVRMPAVAAPGGRNHEDNAKTSLLSFGEAEIFRSKRSSRSLKAKGLSIWQSHVLEAERVFCFLFKESTNLTVHTKDLGSASSGSRVYEPNRRAGKNA